MKYFISLSSGQPKITEKEAKEKGFFGPVYHGSTPEGRRKIQREGFRVFIDHPRKGGVRHGYLYYRYPIHHLGFGVYFFTIKSLAKELNNDTAVTKTYYIRAPRMLTLDITTEVEMERWWKSQGFGINDYRSSQIAEHIDKESYEAKQHEEARLLETIRLTNTLRNKYDAIWFVGKKHNRQVLDGDQVVVFNPENIYEIVPEPFTIGSKVRRKSDGKLGTLISREEFQEEDIEYHIKRIEGSMYLTEDSYEKRHKLPFYKKLKELGNPYVHFTVKWFRGNLEYEILQKTLEPVIT